MVNDNSLSLILRRIKPNSSVLEFGCAHGRMTKYLKEQLNCSVSIVEKDLDAGFEAAKYASHAIVGVDLNYGFNSSELTNKFDYIIFADVLEHLYSPETILKECAHLLKEDGLIWISVPNMAHNSIILELINDNFPYKEVGLLDNSHIRFFTEKTLEQFVINCGYNIADKLVTQLYPENTEFNSDYSLLPEHVAEFLKSRSNAITYQFVWCLKNK